MRSLIAAVICCSLLAAPGAPSGFAVTPEIQRALDTISPDDLRGNLSFLASDLLEGRATPSRGLDIAAEFIASRFRAAGLEPGGDDGYFQNAKFMVREPDLEGFACKLESGGEVLTLDSGQVRIRGENAIDLGRVQLYKVSSGEPIDPGQVSGKAVLVEPRRGARFNLRGLKPALVLVIQSPDPEGPASPSTDLIDAEMRQPAGLPTLIVTSQEAVSFADKIKPGLSGASLSAHVKAPGERTVTLHNVIGILRGSDPELAKTCIIVSAHYDHLGEKPSGKGDRIYNGANDDGSGTVSVLELAGALAKLNPRPKRSIVFITFFGEEEGLFGSRYYVRHPVFPLAQTVADINLEQIGRTDSTEGNHTGTAFVTGSDFSEVNGVLKAAGQMEGVKVEGEAQKDSRYFAASDNLPFAVAGIPAHTICTAFEYADYHGVGDEWPKVDYTNMAKIDRMAAAAILMLADDVSAPRWNAQEEKTAPYLKAWKSLHP